MEHLLGEPQHLEHAEHVGAELDAGADLLELRRLLQHLDRDALARQRQRGREPADPAADDDHLIGGTHHATPGIRPSLPAHSRVGGPPARSSERA